MGEFGVCEEGDGSGDGGKQGGEGRDKGVLYEAGNPENRSSTIQLSLGLTVLVNNPPEGKRPRVSGPPPTPFSEPISLLGARSRSGAASPGYDCAAEEAPQ